MPLLYNEDDDEEEFSGRETDGKEMKAKRRACIIRGTDLYDLDNTNKLQLTIGVNSSSVIDVGFWSSDSKDNLELIQNWLALLDDSCQPLVLKPVYTSTS